MFFRNLPSFKVMNMCFLPYDQISACDNKPRRSGAPGQPPDRTPNRPNWSMTMPMASCPMMMSARAVVAPNAACVVKRRYKISPNLRRGTCTTTWCANSGYFRRRAQHQHTGQDRSADMYNKTAGRLPIRWLIWDAIGPCTPPQSSQNTDQNCQYQARHFVCSFDLPDAGSVLSHYTFIFG